MMCFMSDEVIEEVKQIGREVLPCGRRNFAATLRTEPDHVDDAFAAAFKRA